MDTDTDGIFPNETWMACFQFMDRPTLKSIRLVCHVFASLAWDVLIRDITWGTPATALDHAQHWVHNPVFHRDVSVCLEHPTDACHWADLDDPIDASSNTLNDLSDDVYMPARGLTKNQVARIFERIRSFPNLEALTLRSLRGAILDNLPEVFRELPKLRALTFVGGNISPNLADVLQGLPGLTQLTLDYGALTPALAELAARSPLSSNITNLKINLRTGPLTFKQPWSAATVPAAGLFALLPRLHTLHIHRCFIPIEILPSGITLLTIGFPRVSDPVARDHGKAHLCQVLRTMPQVERLTTYLCDVEYDKDHYGLRHHYTDEELQALAAQHDPPRLLHLTHFTGAASLARVALADANAVEVVNVKAEDEEEAIEFIQFLKQQSHLVRRFSVELPFWSSKVAWTLLRCFRQCEHLVITYSGTGSAHLGKLNLSLPDFLEDIVIEQDNEEAIELILFLAERKAPVRRLSVRLPFWNSKVARTALRCLPDCERLVITYVGTGSAELGKLDLSPSHVLEDVVIKQNTPRAISLIHFLAERKAPVKRLAVELPSWASEVARVISRCLPQCERVEITYAGSGSAKLGKSDLYRSNILEEVSINQSSEGTIEFIKFLEERKAPVRRLSVALPFWSVEIARVICLSLPLCEHLDVTYATGEPSEEALVDLGTEFIPLLAHLREISILRVPLLEQPNLDRDAGKMIEVVSQKMGSLNVETGAIPLIHQRLPRPTFGPTVQGEVVCSHQDLVDLEETEDELNLRGIIFCWTRYNHDPALQRVCLSGRGTTKWVRELDRDTNKWNTM
ncbi:hypothetical protein FB451DRAFT_1207835, partial [Mycena latifolia]